MHCLSETFGEALSLAVLTALAFFGFAAQALYVWHAVFH
jgi:hypothetical protein